LKAFEQVKEGVDDVWVKPYQKPKTPNVHQFVYFYKPEATNVRHGVKLETILRDSLPLLEKGVDGKPVTVGAIRVLGGSYLEKNNTMTQHYGVIAKISREGLPAISESSAKTLKEKYADEVSHWTPEYYASHVIGGHQFLARFPELNAFSLLALADNIPTIRLGPGTYANKIKIRGESFIVLNGFHAYQVVPYNTRGNAIIVLECLSEVSWADLRGKLAGPTDPTTAPDGSIRNLLLKLKEKFGLEAVDRGSNGVHMSAGPLEGMVELRRFFSDHDSLTFTDLAFGNLLDLKGADISKLSQNPDVDFGGKRQSVFDITEEKDAQDAANILVALNGN